MRKSGFFIFVCVLLTGITVYLSSCSKKNETNPPSLTLVNGVGYVSDDTTLYRGTNFSIFVYATKAGLNDLLESGTISKRVNNNPDSVITRFSFVSTQFSQFYSYVLGDSGTVTTYTVSIGNENGVNTSDSVRITAN